MISPEKNIYSGGVKTPDYPGVDQKTWKYNSSTNNYDYIEPENPETVQEDACMSLTLSCNFSEPIKVSSSRLYATSIV